MTMLTATKARARLSHWLKRAAAGEKIGIQCGGGVIALRLLSRSADIRSYARREYGVTNGELTVFQRRVKAEVARDRRLGRMKSYTGNFHAAISD